ncbi:MAG: hypothetical protein NTV88_02705 [Candidatus Micrarchaeota archaeon]|nr:hypothetical protein [Candidatus Micrarchaeota archaeon]
MFGTSGIRGVYGKDVTTALAAKVGNAVGGMGKKIVLSRDCRSTSPILSEALSAGAMENGASVLDMGICPTPLLAYATMKENCDGAMITASHNPPEYNGIKLFSSDKPGTFVRNLEPNPSTLTETAKLVVKNKCDFGVAFDGDGDRALAIDEKGKVLGLDTQLAIFCSHFMQKDGNRKIVSTVEASLCVRDTVESLHGKVFITPVGSLHVAEEVKKQGAIFGGEPCGEYVFPSATPCAEGLLSALFIAEIFTQKGPLSALSAGVKTYPMERRKYRCDEAKKFIIMQKIAEKPQLEGHLSTADGLRYDFSEGWMLIRASGTEPAIRLTAEAKTQKKLGEIMQRAEDLIMRAMDAAK